MRLARRTVAAAAVMVLGVAFCFVMYWWQLQYRYAFHGATGFVYWMLALSIVFAVDHILRHRRPPG
jgi:hypothetical protein